MLGTLLRHPLAKPVWFTASLVPLIMLVTVLATDPGLSDPAKVAVDETGLWALRLLWLCLTLTPLKWLTRCNDWIRFRRMAGLFAFFYASLHALAYWFLLYQGQWSDIARELSKRPYIIAGLSALLVMLPLAVTSTAGWQRRLRKRWLTLHQSIYLVAVVALLHFTWLKKLGIKATAVYALVLALLFIVRLGYRWPAKG